MDDDKSGAAVGAGLTLLMIGAALGAAATLLMSSPPGQQLKAQVSGVADDWQAKAVGWRARAADALAQGRERVIEAVEAQRSA